MDAGMIQGAIASGDIFANPNGEDTIDGIPISKCLGIMLGMTLKDMLVPFEAYVAKAKELGIPEEYIPSPPGESDAFRSSLHVVETREVVNINGIGPCRVEYTVDQPHNTEWYTISERAFGKKDGATKFNNLVRQRALYSVKRVPGNKSDDGKPHVMILPYTDKAEPGDDDGQLERFRNMIEVELEALLRCFNSQHIRNSIKRYIRDHRGIPYTVSSGGTFFVPIDCIDVIRSWENLFAWLNAQNFERRTRIYNGSSSRLVIKAVLNTEKERLFVLEDVQEELANRHRKWLKNMLHYVKSEKNDDDAIATRLETILQQKGAISADIVDSYKALLGKEIQYQLHDEVVSEVQAVTVNGKEPSARLKGLFDQMVTV